MLEIKIKAKGRRYVSPEGLKEVFGPRRARQELGDMIEALLLQMDMIDGDPDFENDTSDFEPGGDELGDPAWCEWHTLTGMRRKSGELNAKPIDEWRGMIGEDEEEDDPREANGDEHDTNGDEGDTNNAEDEVLAGAALQYRASGPGCAITDPPELTAIESVYRGSANLPWYDDDDEPRLAAVAWPAQRPAYFYRPPANLN